jgi:hypothetical protein
MQTREKLAFRNISMKWHKEVCVHCARVQKDAYYRILLSCKLYRHGFCRCNQQTKQILSQEKSNNEGFKVRHFSLV